MSYIKGVGAIAIMLLLAGLAYFLYHNTKPATPTSSAEAVDNFQPAPGFSRATADAETVESAAPSPPRMPPSGFKEYRSATYRFSLFYPGALRVQEFDEGGGARTIIFEDTASAQGFQIFIVPYAQTQISVERFKMDQPSGVMQDSQDLNIDGTLATMFIGKDQLLGPTREVWFIHGGYLFEVTAPQALDEWLGNIMLSWKFI